MTSTRRTHRPTSVKTASVHPGALTGAGNVIGWYIDAATGVRIDVYKGETCQSGIAPKITTQALGRQWLVASASQPGTQHVVIRHEGRLSCSCEGFLWRSKCRHTTAVDDAVYADAARAERITALVARHNPLTAKRVG